MPNVIFKKYTKGIILTGLEFKQNPNRAVCVIVKTELPYSIKLREINRFILINYIPTATQYPYPLNTLPGNYLQLSNSTPSYSPLSYKNALPYISIVQAFIVYFNHCLAIIGDDEAEIPKPVPIICISPVDQIEKTKETEEINNTNDTNEESNPPIRQFDLHKFGTGDYNNEIIERPQLPSGNRKAFIPTLPTIKEEIICITPVD